MKTETEALTLERWIQNGDADAFSEISRLYAGMVYGTCLRITGDKEQAADAAQETFFQLLKSARKVTGSLGSWLHQVATRRAIDLVRRDISRRRREEAFASSTLPETDNWADISPLVDEAISELDEALRDILLRHYLQGQSMTEIAAAHKISQPTVSRRVDRALTDLREKLRAKGVRVALAALAALMANAVQAAPPALLAELGKMSLTASGIPASTADTPAEAPFDGAPAVQTPPLTSRPGFKVAIVAAVAVWMSMLGIGGFLAARHILIQRSQSSRAVLTQAPPPVTPANTAGQPGGPGDALLTTTPAPPVPVAIPGATRVAIGGGAGAVGFGGVAAGLPAAVSEQVNLGRAYGNDGDWRRAFECFQKEIAAGSTDGWGEWEWAWATGAALAAGETNTCREWCSRLLEKFGSSENPDLAERCAKLVLALPDLSGELLEKAAGRADFAIGLNADNRYRQLAKGMAEYRRGHWSDALEWLRRPERSGTLEVAFQACAFSAMARHQLGDTAGARRALDAQSRRLKMVLRTGDLGGNSWAGFATAIALRAEAERVILGRETSPPVAPASVVEQRQKWRSVVQQINAAERLAVNGNWAAARDAYAQVLAHADFDWDPWQLRSSVVAQQMAAVFLQAGDEARHRELCQSLLSRPHEDLPLTTQERNAWVYLVKMDHFSSNLRTQALAAVRATCQSAETENSSWIWLICGLAADREGRTDDALHALDQAQFGNDLPATARMLLYRALLCQRAGLTNEAAATLQDSEGFSARTSPQSSGWWNRVFHQLARQELRVLMETPGEKPGLR